ncbi:MAG TPA: tetratricopeptide repeat protein [Burkholderiaceae bacterium]|jgi:predicted negative regulator of RcsB-dependent stress response
MAYDLEEQEQLDMLKAWWAKYGNLITWVLIAALAAFAGWTYWNKTQQSHNQEAASLYKVMQTAVEAKDNAKMQTAAADIRKTYAGTVYAQFAALAVAKSAAEANDLKGAKVQLQWVIDSAFNDEFVAIAKVRLAGVLMDEKSYDDAMKLLSGDVPSPLQALVLDRKGDILVAQNKIVEARAMYQSAIDKTEDKSPARQLIQAKLDAIGGATVVAKSAA